MLVWCVMMLVIVGRFPWETGQSSMLTCPSFPFSLFVSSQRHWSNPQSLSLTFSFCSHACGMERFVFTYLILYVLEYWSSPYALDFSFVFFLLLSYYIGPLDKGHIKWNLTRFPCLSLYVSSLLSSYCFINDNSYIDNNSYIFHLTIVLETHLMSLLPLGLSCFLLL